MPRHEATGFELLQPLRQDPRGDFAWQCATQCAKSHRLFPRELPDDLTHPFPSQEFHEIFNATAGTIDLCFGFGNRQLFYGCLLCAHGIRRVTTVKIVVQSYNKTSSQRAGSAIASRTKNHERTADVEE